MGCRSTSYEVEQPRPGDSMRITHIPQYKSIPGFTTEILSDHPILIRRDSKGKPRLLLALGDGTEDSCRLGIHGAGRRDLVAFTPSKAGNVDHQNSHSVHLTVARHDLQNSGRMEYVAGREL